MSVKAIILNSSYPENFKCGTGISPSGHGDNCANGLNPYSNLKNIKPPDTFKIE